MTERETIERLERELEDLRRDRDAWRELALRRPPPAVAPSPSLLPMTWPPSLPQPLRIIPYGVPVIVPLPAEPHYPIITCASGSGGHALQ